MEDCVAQLRRLVEKLRGPSRIVRSQRLHLLEDVEELCGREGVEGAGDRVGATNVRRELFALGQGAESRRSGAGGGRSVVASSIRRLSVVATARGVLVRLS